MPQVVFKKDRYYNVKTTKGGINTVLPAVNYYDVLKDFQTTSV